MKVTESHENKPQVAREGSKRHAEDPLTALKKPLLDWSKYLVKYFKMLRSGNISSDTFLRLGDRNAVDPSSSRLGL